MSAGCGSPPAAVAREHIGPASGAEANRANVVSDDPDDPAIWIHPTDPSKSLILGTDKVESNGVSMSSASTARIRQSITPLDRPNNVDVEYGMSPRRPATDIAVMTERNRHGCVCSPFRADGGR